MNVIKALQRIIYFTARDKTLDYYYSFFLKNISLQRNEMIGLQNKLVTRLISHAYHQTVYYRNLMDSLNLTPADITSKDDLRKLPELDKSTIRSHIDEIKSTGTYGRNLTRDTSGGSTGNQAVFYRSPHYTFMCNAALLRCFMLTGWDRNDRSTWLWNDIYDRTRLKESIVARIGLLINRIQVIDTIKRTPATYRNYVERISRFKPKVLFGNARMIADFAMFLKNESISLPTIRLVVTSVEKLAERDLIKSVFNSPVFDLYSSRECHGIAVEFAENIMCVCDDHVVLDINDNDECVITALHSYGFPLINYRIGDKAERVDLPHEISQPYNLPLSTMRIRIGRISEDFLTIQGEKVCSTALLTNISREELNVREQQIIQTGYQSFIVRYVPQQDTNPRYRELLQNMLTDYFGDKCSITFEQVEEIPLEPSGKQLLCKRTFQLD